LLLPVVASGEQPVGAVPRWRVAKNVAPPPAFAGAMPESRQATPISVSSLAPRQTCQPSAQRSSTVQAVPVGLLPSFPAARPQPGAIDRSVSKPGSDQPPAQPAIAGKRA
jgi:hypothetical protein